MHELFGHGICGPFFVDTQNQGAEEPGLELANSKQSKTNMLAVRQLEVT